MRWGLPTETIMVMHKILAQHPAVEQAIIYGSRAKGTDHPGSDIDLTLVGKDLSFDDLLKIMQEFYESAIPYTVDLSMWDLIEDINVRNHIDRCGQVFFDREKDASSVFEKRYNR